MAFPGATGALLIGLPAAAGYFTFCGACALVIGARRGVAARRHRGEESAVTGHRAGVRAGVRVPVPQPLPGRARRLREPAVRQLPRHHPRAGAGAGDRLPSLALAFFAVARAAAAVRLRRRGGRAGARRPVARCRSAFLLSSASRSRRPRRSPACCWCSRCWSRPPATAQLITPRIGASLALTVCSAWRSPGSGSRSRTSTTIPSASTSRPSRSPSTSLVRGRSRGDRSSDAAAPPRAARREAGA